jgi:hypothetical protein
MFFLIILPQIIYDIQNNISIVNGYIINTSVNSFDDNFQDFFTKNSLLYYGHYNSYAWAKCMAFIFLILNALYIIFNLIFNAYKLGSNYSKYYNSDKVLNKVVGNGCASTVFAKWEYTLSNIKSIELQRKQITYELNVSNKLKIFLMQ